jgi:hypothetical protein
MRCKFATGNLAKKTAKTGVASAFHLLISHQNYIEIVV